MGCGFAAVVRPRHITHAARRVLCVALSVIDVDVDVFSFILCV